MIAYTILAVEVVVVGAVFGTLLPLDKALVAVLVIEFVFVAVWSVVLRRITKARFGVALPRLDRE